MENLEGSESAKPSWWEEGHTSAWDRVKDAFRRDWEQTKADFSKKHGQDLDQNVGDTVKQAAGSKPVPPLGVPNPPDIEKEWKQTEPAARYGFGARARYGKQFKDWDERVETKLKDEWSDLDEDRKFDEARDDIRRGWEYGDPMPH